MEKNSLTTAQLCTQQFLQKGGTLHVIANLTANNEAFPLHSGDAIYPVCSGGWCRSQSLWAILQPFSDQMILFPPHAARVGWDPYNGQINRYRNYAQEELHDEFSNYFGMEKSPRFGFEHSSVWREMESSPTHEGLKSITQFYNENYFGPNSHWQGKKGERRVYIAFSNNAHVVLYRLNQSNETLKNVIVIAIDSEDLVTYPPAFLNTTPRSQVAYHHFSTLLSKLFKFNYFE